MNTLLPVLMFLTALLAGSTTARASLMINEILADPAFGPTGDANGDGSRSGSQDEFIELVNVSGGPVDIGDWTISDGVRLRHVFDPGTVIQDQTAVLIFGGGTPTGLFGGARVLTASTDTLGLNNSGDQISLMDAMANLIDMVIYGSEGGGDQSITLDPDLTGARFVKHSTSPSSSGALFSPGTRIDGTPFGPSGVPEPGALLLLGLGFCCLNLANRRWVWNHGSRTGSSLAGQTPTLGTGGP